MKRDAQIVIAGVFVSLAIAYPKHTKKILDEGAKAMEQWMSESKKHPAHTAAAEVKAPEKVGLIRTGIRGAGKAIVKFWKWLY